MQFLGSKHMFVLADVAHYLEERHFWDDIDHLFHNAKKISAGDHRLEWVRDLEHKWFSLHAEADFDCSWKYFRSI